MKQLIFIAALITMGFATTNQNNSALTRRSEMASTLLGDKIYIAGGINFW